MLASATNVASIPTLPAVWVAIDACWLEAADDAVVSVLVAEKLKQYSTPTVKSPEPNVTTLAGLVDVDAVVMLGQAVEPAGIGLTFTVQLAAVVLTV
jgi:hypothetical protein